jgi:glutamate transport system permease protein
MDVVVENFHLYYTGFLKTLGICLWAAAGSVLLGTSLAALRVSPVQSLQWMSAGYVNALRNCPLTVVLFFVAFGLPELGLNCSYYWFAVSALVLYTAAFICEAARSGINSVPQGQAEAARSIGMSFSRSLRLVILPQALRSVVPPLGSVIIAMIKNSAIVGAFGVGGELFSVGDTLTGSRGYAALPVLSGVLIGYLLITVSAGLLIQILERKATIAR